MNEQALFRLVFYWILMPLLILLLGLRRLKRTWPLLIYSGVAGAYLYLLWTDKMTVGILLLAIPLLLFAWFLKRRGV